MSVLYVPMDCSLQTHSLSIGIFQVRILKALPFPSPGGSLLGSQTNISCTEASAITGVTGSPLRGCINIIKAITQKLITYIILNGKKLKAFIWSKNWPRLYCLFLHLFLQYWKMWANRQKRKKTWNWNKVVFSFEQNGLLCWKPKDLHTQIFKTKMVVR